MRVRSTTLATAAVCIALAAQLSCTNQKLVPIKDDLPKNVDDLIDVETEFCTRPAENVVFPVKILLVLDTSGSMQFTDALNLRAIRVQELMNNLRTQNDVLVSTLGFGSNAYFHPAITSADGPYFVTPNEWLASPPPWINLKDVTTDYEGGLSAVKTHIFRDMDLMSRTDPATLARTKYVVLFFSDGSPDPRCCITADETDGARGADPFNCPLENWEQGLDTTGLTFCEDAEENPRCNDQTLLDFFRDGVADDAGFQNLGQPPYGDEGGTLQALNDLEVDANYNRTYQIQDIVSDIIDLGEEFGAGKITVNTALLFDESLDDGVKQIYRLNHCRSASLLESMAEIGGGVFRDFSQAEDIDFLSFNFTSLKERFQLLSTFVVNPNALPPGSDPDVVDYRPDSDADGLDDATEFADGTDPVVADSDKQVTANGPDETPVLLEPDQWGDGFDDAFEKRRESLGFDGRFTSLPLTSCSTAPQFDFNDARDLDADGLNGCEEHFLDSNPVVADTDGDTIPDGVEVRLDLDPTVNDEGRDDDFDGTPNLEEVRKGRDPYVPDADRESTAARYELTETGTTDDGRTCYQSIVRGVHLTTTAPRFSGGRKGYNDVAVYIAEALAGSPGLVHLRVACARAQYIKPTFKDPSKAVLKLQEDDFFDMDAPDTLLDPNDPTRLADICQGLAVR